MARNSGILAAIASRTIGGAVLAVSLSSGWAAADPLLVQQGGLTYEGDPFGYSLAGDGFWLTGGGTGIRIGSPLGRCDYPCRPGTSLHLSTVIGDFLTPGRLGYGNASIGGRTFETVRGYVLFGGMLLFDAPYVSLPPAVADEQLVQLRAPFSLRGQVAAFDVMDMEWTPGDRLFRSDFRGYGDVTYTAQYDAACACYIGRSVTYEFSPVPEPATVLLLAAGITAVAARFRRPSSRHRGESRV